MVFTFVVSTVGRHVPDFFVGEVAQPAAESTVSASAASNTSLKIVPILSAVKMFFMSSPCSNSVAGSALYFMNYTLRLSRHEWVFMAKLHGK